ncbi:MAG: RNA methyltransferase [Phycisphaerales bacterium]|nr:RNA methyltransferase [Phycisphaerales bacterium]
MKNEANLIQILAPEDDRLTEYRCLRENRLARPMVGAPHGVFIAEGEKVVRLLILQSAYRVRSLLISASRSELAAEYASLVGPDVPVYIAERPVMDAVVGFPIHRGVLASGVRVNPPRLESVLNEARACLVLESLANHDNVGGIMRVAAALGGCDIQGRPACPVIMDHETCDPLYRKAIRVSMGHALRVPFATVESLPTAIDELDQHGFTTLALTTGADAVSIDDLEPVDRPAFVLGTEGDGLSEAALSQVKVRVRIPMSPGVDSLNVVTAAAIALSRLVRPV